MAPFSNTKKRFRNMSAEINLEAIGFIATKSESIWRGTILITKNNHGEFAFDLIRIGFEVVNDFLD